MQPVNLLSTNFDTGYHLRWFLLQYDPSKNCELQGFPCKIPVNAVFRILTTWHSYVECFASFGTCFDEANGEMNIVSFDSAGFPCNAGNRLMQAGGLGKVQILSQSSTNFDTSYHLKWFLLHCDRTQKL